MYTATPSARVTFQIKHDNGSMVDSITASLDKLWTEKQFTNRHGKESIAAKGTFQLWRDETDPRMIVLSMINKIPDGDVASKCYSFVVQVHANSAYTLQPVYHNAATHQPVDETRFAMASKTPDEIASKAQRAGGSGSGSSANGKSTTKRPTAASCKASSRVRANHKGAATKAKKPRSVSPLNATAATRNTARSSRVAAAWGKAKAVDPTKAKVVTAAGGKARKIRSSKSSRPKTAKTRAPRRESKVAAVRSASPIDLNPFVSAAAAVEQHLEVPQQTPGALEQAILDGDLGTNATGGWGSCPAPVLNEDDDDHMIVGGLEHAKEESVEEDGRNEHEIEMLMHTGGGSSRPEDLFSPVFSDGSFSRSSSVASQPSSASAPDYTGVESTPAPFLPQPQHHQQHQQQHQQHHYEQQVQMNPPAPNLGPPLAFGTVPHDMRPLPQPAAQALGGYAYSYASMPMSSPMTTPAPGHAAGLLAANTPLVVAIAPDPDRPPTPPPPQPAALDMDLTNGDSCSSWCDGPEAASGHDTAMAGAISMEESPHGFGGMFSSPLHASAFASAPGGGVSM